MQEDFTTYLLHIRNDCPFCDEALHILKENSKDYCAVIHEAASPSLLQEQRLWEWNTVPIIIAVTKNEHDDEVRRLIGGYTDLCNLLGIQSEI